MTHFIQYNALNAPQDAKENLQNLNEALGFIPNIFATVAESPLALKALMDLNQTFSISTFSAQEQQIIMLATSTENECVYCVAGHSAFASNLGIAATTVDKMRNKQALSNKRLNILNLTARRLIQTKGRIAESALTEFLAQGFSKTQFFELVMGICVKTFTNYCSNALSIPLDEAFEPFAWQRPSDKTPLKPALAY